MSWYQGTVADVDDPLQAGRVRAWIHDLFWDHTEQQPVMSPWIEASTGMGDGAGGLNVPPVGAPLRIFKRWSSDGALYLLSYTSGNVARGEAGQVDTPAVGRGVDDETTSALKQGVPFEVPSRTSEVGVDHGSPSLVIQSETVDGFPGSTNAGKYPHVRHFKIKPQSKQNNLLVRFFTKIDWSFNFDLTH